MEFHEKLQILRKQKGLTQEELAASLYVSRTAVSKWESARGYPNIDSLKAIASFFSVTIDELLSGDELLTIAEEDNKQKELKTRNLVFGLLDLSTSMFLLLPFFGKRADGAIQSVSLLSLTEIAPYLQCIYWIAVIAMIIVGVLTLCLQRFEQVSQKQTKISLSINAAAAFIFIISLQPYAAAFLFIFLTIKVLILIRKQ